MLNYDTVIHAGKPAKPPKFYMDKLAIENPDRVAALKKARRAFAKPSDNTPERLAVKEEFTKRKHNYFAREPGKERK